MLGRKAGPAKVQMKDGSGERLLVRHADLKRVKDIDVMRRFKYKCSWLVGKPHDSHGRQMSETCVGSPEAAVPRLEESKVSRSN